MICNQHSIITTYPDENHDEYGSYEKHIASDEKTKTHMISIRKSKAFFKSLYDNARKTLDSLRISMFGILHKTKLIMILHAKSHEINFNNHDYYSISDNPERIAEIKNNQVIETINVNDYIGLFTFNINDLNEFNLMSSDTSHYYLDNENVSLGVLCHYVEFYMYLNDTVNMRELIFTKIIKDLIDNWFFNDSYDDYHVNMYGLLSYVNSIMQGYPVEYSIENMKIESFNTQDESIINPYYESDEHESVVISRMKRIAKQADGFRMIIKWVLSNQHEE